MWPKYSTIWQLLIRVIYKVTLSSPCLWASFHPYPLFQWYPQSKDIRLNLSMKCWNSAFNARGPRLTNCCSCTVRSSENICSDSGDAQERGKTGWNSVYHQNWWFSEFHLQLHANVLFCRFFFWISGFWCCVFLTLRITLLTSWNSLWWPGLHTI
jgi:hypothetical protein